MISEGTEILFIAGQHRVLFSFGLCWKVVLYIMNANTLSFRTTLTTVPEIAGVKINLLDLYQTVTSEGGYDKITGTKGMTLLRGSIAWVFPKANAIHTLLARTDMILTCCHRRVEGSIGTICAHAEHHEWLSAEICILQESCVSGA